MDSDHTTDQRGQSSAPKEKAAVSTASSFGAPTPEHPRPPVQGPGSIDLEKILLPKKDSGPSIGSAQRVNAAAVFEAAQAPLVPEAPALPPSPAEQAKAAIPSLETYKGDIEQIVRNKNISLVDIAAAQARASGKRRVTDDADVSAARKSLMRYAEVGAGAIVVALSLLLLVYAFLRPSSSSLPGVSLPASIMYVDALANIPIVSGETRDTLMQWLLLGREQASLSLGLVAQVNLAHASSTSQNAILGNPLTAQEFLSLLAPNASSELTLALAPDFLLGIHSFDGNQPFLVFKTNSYNQAYAGMLNWEPSMQSDLSPLFDRTPTAHIPEEGNTAAQAIAAPQLLQTPFVDRVVENHDSRVIENGAGDILLLWTFVDRQTLVITTNEYTLREIISRLAQAPVVSVPGQ